MPLSADYGVYARNSGTTTMCPCGLKARYTVQSCCPPAFLYGAEAWTVYRRHDTTSAFDHEDNLDGHSDKQRNTRMDKAAIYGRSSDQKKSPVDWTPHEDVTRQATKAGSLLSTVFWLQKEGRSRLRFKDTIKRNQKLRDKHCPMDTTRTAERYKWRAIVK